jgi:hypothetical protein
MSLLELSGPEQRILRAAGGLVDLRSGRPGADDPAQGGAWGAGRTVRAGFLREVLAAAREPYGAPGVRTLRLRGARITGVLDLEGMDLTCSVLLQDCHFEEPVNLHEARAPSIRLAGSHLPSLEARQVEVRGDLALGGLTAASLDLLGARIGGVLAAAAQDQRPSNATGSARTSATVRGSVITGSGQIGHAGQPPPPAANNGTQRVTVSL